MDELDVARLERALKAVLYERGYIDIEVGAISTTELRDLAEEVVAAYRVANSD